MPCTGITPFAWASPNCSVPAMLLGRASVSMNAVVRHTSQRTLQDPESHTAGCVLSTFSAGPRCWHIYLETVGECMERYTHEIYLLTVNMYHHVSMYHLSLYESYANNIQIITSSKYLVLICVYALIPSSLERHLQISTFPYPATPVHIAKTRGRWIVKVRQQHNLMLHIELHTLHLLGYFDNRLNETNMPRLEAHNCEVLRSQRASQSFDRCPEFCSRSIQKCKDVTRWTIL